METFALASCPASYALGVEIGACGSTAFLQAEIKLSESLFDDPRFQDNDLPRLGKGWAGFGCLDQNGKSSVEPLDHSH